MWGNLQIYSCPVKDVVFGCDDSKELIMAEIDIAHFVRPCKFIKLYRILFCCVEQFSNFVYKSLNN